MKKTIHDVPFAFLCSWVPQTCGHLWADCRRGSRETGQRRARHFRTSKWVNESSSPGSPLTVRPPFCHTLYRRPELFDFISFHLVFTSFREMLNSSYLDPPPVSQRHILHISDATCGVSLPLWEFNWQPTYLVTIFSFSMCNFSCPQHSK